MEESQIEDAQVIEQTDPIEEEKELTPEEKEQQEKFFRSWVINNNRYHLRSIFDYMRKKKVTLAQIKEEIINKECGLSRVQRDFIISFQLDFLGQLLKDMYGDKFKDNEEK